MASLIQRCNDLLNDCDDKISQVYGNNTCWWLKESLRGFRSFPRQCDYCDICAEL